MAIWDVAAQPEREQFAYWHEVICQAFVPLTPRSDVATAGFDAKVETRPIRDVMRARLRSQPQRTLHGPREVARTSGAYYFVNLQLAGRCRTRQGRVESIVEPGQFTIVDTTQPYDFAFSEPWQMLSYKIPHVLLDARLGGARPRLGERFDAAGVSGVVRSMLTSLWPVDAQADQAAAELEMALASAVAATTADRRAARLTRADLRAEIMRDVHRRLADPDLSVTSVCHRLGIATRTLHAAFAAAEQPFAATVRTLRLRRCAELLADPDVPGTITDIAASVGFLDPASFSRAFRREFGCAPRDARNAHRGRTN